MVHAGAPATLKGLVENELHSVAGASVALSELGRSVTTDSDRELEIGGFEPGNYTMAVSASDGILKLRATQSWGALHLTDS